MDNGAGLQRDFEVIRSLCDKNKIGVTGIPVKHNPGRCVADVSIFLELLNDQLLNLSPKNWLIPNSEWWTPGWDEFLPRIDKILCKTHDCYRIWSQKVGAERCVYTGFEALDYYDPRFIPEKNFLHLAGVSITKNTQIVLEAWNKYRPPVDLILVTTKQNWLMEANLHHRITPVKRIADSHIHHYLNSSLFHLMPSQYEGYGQALHEAMACGRIVLTTDAPPMNEFGTPKDLLIPSVRTETKDQAEIHFVSPEGIIEAVEKALALTPKQIADYSKEARENFLKERDFFRAKFLELLTDDS